MNPRTAVARGGFAAAACVACCALPIIAALGVTAGLAVTAGVFLGLAAAIAVVLLGAAWITARARRNPNRVAGSASATSTPVAAPIRRERS